MIATTRELYKIIDKYNVISAYSILPITYLYGKHLWDISLQGY